MIHTLERGGVESKIIADAKRYGRPIPEKILNAPSVRMGLELFYKGFLDLTSERYEGADRIGPIPFLSIIKYCETFDITGEQREDFIWFVTRLDAKFISWKAGKNAKNPGHGKTDA